MATEKRQQQQQPPRMNGCEGKIAFYFSSFLFVISFRLILKPLRVYSFRVVLYCAYNGLVKQDIPIFMDFFSLSHSWCLSTLLSSEDVCAYKNFGKCRKRRMDENGAFWSKNQTHSIIIKNATTISELFRIWTRSTRVQYFYVMTRDRISVFSHLFGMQTLNTQHD